jgi:hypothetical protein
MSGEQSQLSKRISMNGAGLISKNKLAEPYYMNLR